MRGHMYFPSGNKCLMWIADYVWEDPKGSEIGWSRWGGITNTAESWSWGTFGKRREFPWVKNQLFHWSGFSSMMHTFPGTSSLAPATWQACFLKDLLHPKQLWGPVNWVGSNPYDLVYFPSCLSWIGLKTISYHIWSWRCTISVGALTFDQ